MQEKTTTEKTVLFVDDEESILSLVKRTLRKEDYSVLLAKNAHEALAILKDNKVHVVISDQRMPEVSGTELLKQVKHLYPDTVRAIMSGYTSISAVVDSINEGEVYRFIPKPWENEDLLIAIDQCLKHYDVLRDNDSLADSVHSQNVKLRQQKNELEITIDKIDTILQFSQQVLEYLPVSVLGINCAGQILICNEHARTAIHEFAAFEPGAYLNDLIDYGIWNVAKEAIDLRLRICREFSMAGTNYIFEFIPLFNTRIEGLLIIVSKSDI